MKLEISHWTILQGWIDKELIKNNQHCKMPEIAKILSISKSSTEYILQQLDYVSYFDVWIPHKWKKENNWTVFLCAIDYLYIMKIIDNEKWMLYNTECQDTMGQAEWTVIIVPKADFHPKRWCCIYDKSDSKSVFYYELCPK